MHNKKWILIARHKSKLNQQQFSFEWMKPQKKKKKTIQHMSKIIVRQHNFHFSNHNYFDATFIIVFFSSVCALRVNNFRLVFRSNFSFVAHKWYCYMALCMKNLLLIRSVLIQNPELLSTYAEQNNNTNQNSFIRI